MSSGFVTETELAEARKRRQEEWEKVRTADQPLERPEEPFDSRSLFDQLKEQKMKKDLEYEEAHKLKNLIRGLDDDEVQFLELVDQNKLNAEKQQMQDDERELKDFRNRVATLHEESIEKKIQTEIKQTKLVSSSSNQSARPSQKSLLGVGIKRKNGDIDTATSGSSKASKVDETANHKESNGKAEKSKVIPTQPRVLDNITTNEFDRGELRCVAILPGIGRYTASSDSELSSGSDEEPTVGTTDKGAFDLVGRIPIKKKQCHDE